jgi:anti-sigma regulatory factor (Ser/Thr protein kinase)
LFYTDGLTEAARRPADGEQRLRDLIGEPAIFAARHPAQALMNAIFADRLPSDDVAILVMRVTDERTDSSAPIQRWFFDTRDGQAAQAARRAFRDGLGARFANAECIADAELVFGELVGNAARYAPGPLEVCVDWSSAMPVLHVLDEGRGFAHVPSLPRDVYSESGRGLFIISLYSEEFSVSKRPDRGSHARAVLALNRQPFSKRAELVVPEDIDPWALVSSG